MLLLTIQAGASSERLPIDIILVVEDGNLQSLNHLTADLDQVFILEPLGGLLGFTEDGITSTYPVSKISPGDAVRVVRYYRDESYFEFVLTTNSELIGANEKLYPWVLREKAVEIEAIMAEYDHEAAVARLKAGGVGNMGECQAFKFPYQDENPNKLTSYIWHCNCAKYAGDFNWKTGNQDCWLSVLNPARGIVISAGWWGEYGWQVQMYHGFSYWTLMAHGMTSPTNFIDVGNDLLQGTFLMNRGSTGKSTGCHTHFEFWQGRTSKPFDGFSNYPKVKEGGTYRSYQKYVPPPKGNP